MRLTVTWLVFLILYVAMGNASFAASARCDFNDDGFEDLAIGIPEEDIGDLRDAGAVSVIYGRPGGLSVTNNQFWSRNSTNVLGTATADDNFGKSLSCGDFNGDGIDDLAIGAPRADVSGVSDAGNVTVLYGNRKWRLSATGNQLWSEESPGILDSAATEETFGYSVASGDFNGDGFSDLAIGTPEASIFDHPDNGGVIHVLYGSQTGLTSASNQLWSQNSSGIADDRENHDVFGLSLAAADFGKNTSAGCYDDLAIGAPGEDFNAGAVHVLYGSPIGITSAESQFFFEDDPTIPGDGDNFDLFGSSLAAGSFQNQNNSCNGKIADLAVAAHLENDAGIQFAGGAYVLYATATEGLSTTNSQFWDQASPGIANTPQHNDQFGWSITAAQRSSGGDSLVIGVRFENVGTIEDAGAIHILYPDPATGLISATGSKFYHQSTPGIKDIAETNDSFGTAVAAGDFNADGEDDIAVGVAGEGFAQPFAGAIQILYSGEVASNQLFHQNSVDMKDADENADGFGSHFTQ